MEISNAITNQTWKAIPGFEELYEVSSAGQIRRISPARGTWPGRILRHRHSSGGYATVRLAYGDGRKVTKSVHRLVALAFWGDEARQKQVNHLDGDKMNPRLDNLELVTPRQNTRHARDVLGVKFFPGERVRGERHGRSKISAIDANTIREIGSSMKQSDIAAMFGIHPSQVSRIQSGKLWKTP